MKYSAIILLLLINYLSNAQEPKTLWTAAWSPNDHYIAIGGSQGELKIYDGQTYELVRSYSVGDVILSSAKWHPTQNKLAVITQSDSFKAQILDLDSNEWIELEGLRNSLRALDWSQDGSLLAVSEFEGEISVFTSDGKSVSRFMGDDKSVAGLDWHPIKNIIVAVGSTIGLFDQYGDTIQIYKPREEEVFLLCVEWHPTGTYFATGDYGTFQDAENKLIQYWNKDGEQLLETGNSVAEYRNIRWSSNGEYLASANDALRIWDTNGQLIYESESTKDYLWGIDWNSDDSKIVTSSYQGVISIWDSKAQLIKRLN